MSISSTPGNPDVLDAHQLTEIRRYIHQHPEESGFEFQTTKYLAEQVERLGFRYSIGPNQRGLIVDLGAPEAKRRIGLRADIDAIPVADTKQTAYRSKNPKCMHACGHDAHSTMLLGAIQRISLWMDQHPDCELAVRAIFQPEEETAQGAKSLIQHGVLDGVDAIVGMHVDPSRPAGTIGWQTGVHTAHCNEIKIRISGRSGHAARPHESVDPIAVGVQFVQMAYSTIQRMVDSRNATVFTICQFSGGHSSNVTPDEVHLQGTLRTHCRTSRETVIQHLSNLTSSLASTTGARFDLQFGTEVPAVLNDPEVTRLARAAAIDIVGEPCVHEITKASMGGEDFAFYSQEIPASFIRLGCAGQEIGSLPLHNSGFDIDESILTIGADFFARAVVQYAMS